MKLQARSTVAQQLPKGWPQSPARFALRAKTSFIYFFFPFCNCKSGLKSREYKYGHTAIKRCINIEKYFFVCIFYFFMPVTGFVALLAHAKIIKANCTFD